MTAWPVIRVAWSGAARRLVQTVVVFVVVAAAAATAVLGLAMATSSILRFRIAFARSHGAHLAVMVDTAKVTSSQLAATRRLRGVTRAVGYPATTIGLTVPVPRDMDPSGRTSGQVTVVGRASRSGPLDRIHQGTGRWPVRVGEVDLAVYAQARGSIGQVVTATATSVRGRPKLIVVGYGRPAAQDNTQQAWVVPAEITALEKAGAPAQEEMLYTFRHAATPAQVNADLKQIKAALPAGAIVTWSSWLSSAYSWEAAGGSAAPFLVAYAVIALALAVLITAIVAAAAVAASYARIGVLKSIGFTPAQVAATYLARLGVPALAGAVTGTVLGGRWAYPLIKVGVPRWIWLSVPAGLCALAGLAALAPAVRAGRLSAVAAITAGRVPRVRRGYAAYRLADRLPLPRTVSLGLAAPLSRPNRSAPIFAAVTAGLVAMVLAVGLQAQMHQIVIVTGWADNGVRLVGQLTRLVGVLAGLGVFSAVLVLARERVRDLGIFKAVGMTPRQVITMVTCWAVAPAIAAAVIAVPGGIAAEHAVAQAVVSWQTSRMARIAPPPGTGGPPSGSRNSGSGRPPSSSRNSGSGRPQPGASRQVFFPGGRSPRHAVTDLPGHGVHDHSAKGSLPPQLSQLGTHPAEAYTPASLALLVLAGLAIAIAGALGPAIWAAAAKTTRALRTE